MGFRDVTNPSLPLHLVAQRPEGPRADVLDLAGETLAELLGVHTQPVWEVVERRERSRSTLFALLARHSQGRTQAFYKTDFISPDSFDTTRLMAELVRRQRALEVELLLAPQLVAVLGRDNISIDRPLALCPDLLASVRLAVPGRPLGRSTWRGLPGRRRRGREIYQAIGHASRLIEEVGRSLGPALSLNECRDRLLLDMKKSDAALTARQRVILPDTIDRLLSLAEPSAYSAWTHGDLSPSNTLVSAQRVAVIDFSWAPHLAGRDVAQFLVRLHGQTHQYSAWTRQASDALMRGYGVDIRRPEWQLAYLQRLLRCIRKKDKAVRSWGMERLEEFTSGT